MGVGQGVLRARGGGLDHVECVVLARSKYHQGPSQSDFQQSSLCLLGCEPANLLSPIFEKNALEGPDPRATMVAASRHGAGFAEVRLEEHGVLEVPLGRVPKVGAHAAASLRRQ